MIRWYDAPFSILLPLSFSYYFTITHLHTNQLILELCTLPLSRPLHPNRPLQRPPRRPRRLGPEQTHGSQL